MPYVLVLAGALLEQAEALLNKGIHPTKIADGFDLACKKSIQVLDSIAEQFPIDQRDQLVKSAVTSLGSKMFVFLRLYFHKSLFSVLTSVSLISLKLLLMQFLVLRIKIYVMLTLISSKLLAKLVDALKIPCLSRVL